MNLTLLKKDGVFFTILLILFVIIMFSLNAHHAYLAQPLPNQIQEMQAEQAQQQQQQQAVPNNPGAR